MTSSDSACPATHDVSVLDDGWVKVRTDVKSLAVQLRLLPKRVPAQLWPVSAVTVAVCAMTVTLEIAASNQEKAAACAKARSCPELPLRSQNALRKNCAARPKNKVPLPEVKHLVNRS